MIANVTANLLCVGLDAVLVTGAGPVPALGIRGAAWAGVIALSVGAAGLALAAWPRLRRIPAGLDRALLREAVRLGLPIGTQRVLEVLSWSVLTGALAAAGDAQLAAHVMAIRVLMLSFLPGLAIGEATAVLVGQAVGARDEALARRSWAAGAASAFGVMALGGVAFVLVPGVLLAPFHPAADVWPTATRLLQVAAIFQLFDAVATVTYFSLDGAGDTRFTLAASLGVSWFVKLPLGVGLVRYAGFGALGAWIGLTLETVLLLGLLLWRWRSGRWYRAAAPALEPVGEEPPTEEVLA
jgi:MATE family multidrug resistance protein